MSKTLARLRSSSGVSRSNSSVASPASFKHLGDVAVAWAVPAASTAVREDDDPDRVLRNRQMPGHRHRSGAHPDFLITHWRVVGAGGGGLAKTLPGAIEQCDHLVVGGLGEVAVALADGERRTRACVSTPPRRRTR